MKPTSEGFARSQAIMDAMKAESRRTREYWHRMCPLCDGWGRVFAGWDTEACPTCGHAEEIRKFDVCPRCHGKYREERHKWP